MKPPATPPRKRLRCTHISIQNQSLVDPPKSFDKLEDFERFLPPFLRGVGGIKACGVTLEELCVHHSRKRGGKTKRSLGGWSSLGLISNQADNISI
jgi:hypothetical protein